MLKRETRILGLSGARIKDKIMIIGVVFRGSLWLDGVVTASVDKAEGNLNSQISRTIRNTKQFSQLHAIILSPQLALNGKTSIVELSRRVSCPVIQLPKLVKAPKSNRFASAVNLDLVLNGKHVVVTAVGVAEGDVEQLYRIGCSQGSSIPEAVRIADMLAEQLSRRSLNPQRNKAKRTRRRSQKP